MINQVESLNQEYLSLLLSCWPFLKTHFMQFSHVYLFTCLLHIANVTLFESYSCQIEIKLKVCVCSVCTLATATVSGGLNGRVSAVASSPQTSEHIRTHGLFLEAQTPSVPVTQKAHIILALSVTIISLLKSASESHILYMYALILQCLILRSIYAVTHNIW